MIVTSHRELRNRRQRNVANGQISGTSHQGFMKLQLRQSQTRYVYRERGDKYQDQPPGFYEIPATAVTDQVCLYGKGVQISGTSHQGFMKFQLQQSQIRYVYQERGTTISRETNTDTCSLQINVFVTIRLHSYISRGLGLWCLMPLSTIF